MRTRGSLVSPAWKMGGVFGVSIVYVKFLDGTAHPISRIASKHLVFGGIWSPKTYLKQHQTSGGSWKTGYVPFWGCFNTSLPYSLPNTCWGLVFCVDFGFPIYSSQTRCLEAYGYLSFAHNYSLSTFRGSMTSSDQSTVIVRFKWTWPTWKHVHLGAWHLPIKFPPFPPKKLPPEKKTLPQQYIHIYMHI